MFYFLLWLFQRNEEIFASFYFRGCDLIREIRENKNLAKISTYTVIHTVCKTKWTSLYPEDQFMLALWCVGYQLFPAATHRKVNQFQA